MRTAIERLLQPATALCEAPANEPGAPECRRHSDGGRSLASFERHGTFIEIQSWVHSLDELKALSATLVPMTPMRA